MYLARTASRALTVLQDRLFIVINPFYRSVTWLLNQILGSFSLYVGIERKLDPPPDSSIFVDWIPVFAMALLFLVYVAIIFFLVESWLAEGPVKHPHEATSAKFPEDSPSDQLEAKTHMLPPMEQNIYSMHNESMTQRSQNPDNKIGAPK